MKKISDEDTRKVAQIYNENGKSAAFQYIRDNTEIKRPYNLVQRMKQMPELEYSKAADRFESVYDGGEDIFMSVEELCSPVVYRHEIDIDRSDVACRTEAMEQMVHALIGDRLLELDKYIKLDSRSRTILLDKTTLISDGYQVKIF